MNPPSRISSPPALLSDPVIVAFATGVVATSLVFWAIPGLDILVARWFYSPSDGFFLSSDPRLRLLRASSSWALAGVVSIALFRLAREAFKGALVWSRVRTPIWLLSALALGPGLLVNGLLKANWGRPRPIMIDAFGGDAAHQKVWVVSDWCDRNCSFVSGEASSAAWLVAAALVTPKAIRPAAIATAVVYAGALSLNRIAFGGHFLSDIVLAWLLCGLVFAVLYRLMRGRPGCGRRGSLRPRSDQNPANRSSPALSPANRSGPPPLPPSARGATR